MKRLRFERLELLSQKERKARAVDFHPELTVIKGENDVGKSSVIKSLYWVLGAPPAKIHPSWVKARIKGLLTFTIDDERFRIFRDHDTFGVFDEDDNLLLSTNRITSELGPFLGKLLNFQLVLSNRKGVPEIPPPAYALLPFYIDQDNGWSKPLDSFANLGQYPDFKKGLLEFHTGILPNEYYELEARKKAIQLDLKALEADRRVIRKAIERFELVTNFEGLELSAEGHEEAIESLLARLKDLREARQARATKYADILDQRMVLEQQVRAVKESLVELGRDIKFSAALPEEVYCPTCGTCHTNDFAHRYGIIEDREACVQFLTESHLRITALTTEALEVEAELKKTDGALAEIQRSLDSKRGEVTLLEVIESRGRRIASEMFDGQITGLDEDIGALLSEMSNFSDRMKELKDAERREKIVKDYASFILAYLNQLDVVNFDVDQVTKLPATISDTGSDLPRSVLAHFLAIIQTIYKHSDSLFAPIVVDSPNQQDQDKINVGAMIDLIVASRPDDAQTILGTVSLHGRTIPNGKVIEFTKKKSVLEAEDYELIASSMLPYMEQLAP